MRIIMTAAMTGAAMCCASSAMAWEGDAPWCAYINLGTGTMYEQCTYSTVEACVPNILAGNRGFCAPNPRFAWDVPRNYRKRHAKR